MDFIEDFVRETDNGVVPERYRRWAALSTLSAATDRRVWTSIRPNTPLWPNLYVLLVGKPGSGKTLAVQAARAALATRPGLYMTESSITQESLIKELAGRNDPDDPETVWHPSSAAVFVNEFGTFLRRPESDVMALLSDIYDGWDFSRRTIKRGLDMAEHVYVGILGACVPEWFAEGFPHNQYAQGLPTRFFFVWGKKPKPADLPAFVYDDPLGGHRAKYRCSTRVAAGLADGAAPEGFMSWAPEAGEANSAWQAEGFPPEPTDLMLEGYNSRRDIHVAKLSLLVALSRHPRTMRIELSDWERAREVMLEAEPHMGRALSSAGGNEQRTQEDAVAAYVEARYDGSRAPVPEWEVRQALAKTMASYKVSATINGMIASRRFTTVGDEPAPNRRLLPGVRK